MMHGWVADDEYPDGRRWPMNEAETREVDAEFAEAFADALEEVGHPLAAQVAEAARQLRLGID